MAAKLDRKNFMFVDKKDETLVKKKGDINGINFKIRNLQNCTVYLLDHTTGLFIDDCINCKIVVAACDGSIMIRTSKNCAISVVAKQLRFRDCENVQIYSYIESEPVVENCAEIHFAPYNAFLPHQQELFQKANFTPRKNTFHLVYDFTEKEKTELTHWKIMTGEINKEKVQVEGISDENESLYPGYEEEFAYYVANGKLPYDIQKEVVEGENIPIDTTVNKTVGVTIPVQQSLITNTQNNIVENNTGNYNPIIKNDEPIVTSVPLYESRDPFGGNENQFSVNSNQNQNNNFNDFFGSGSNNNKNVNFNQNQDDDIQISGGFNQFVNDYQPNIATSQANYQQPTFEANFGMDVGGDPEEVDAQNKRRTEQEQKYRQLMEKQNKESNDKREMRNKAREFLEGFVQKRQKNQELRHNNNLKEEKVFLDTRVNAKEATKNPWDRVVSLIDLKETDYKGSKEIGRMRQCIINRRYDFSKTLEKK